MDKIVDADKVLAHIPLRFESSLSMEDEHCVTYCSADGRFPLRICRHTPAVRGVAGAVGTRRRAYSHYMLDGEVYRRRQALVVALGAYIVRHEIDVSCYDQGRD